MRQRHKQKSRFFVYYLKARKKYQAFFKIDQRIKYLGTFKHVSDASVSRNEALFNLNGPGGLLIEWLARGSKAKGTTIDSIPKGEPSGITPRAQSSDHDSQIQSLLDILEKEPKDDTI